MRHLAAAVILALSALPPLALAQSADRPGQKAFQAGDRWEWRQLDTLTQLETKQITRTVVQEDGKLMFSDGSRNYPIRAVYEGGKNQTSFRLWRLEVGKKMGIQPGA